MKRFLKYLGGFLLLSIIIVISYLVFVMNLLDTENTHYTDEELSINNEVKAAYYDKLDYKEEGYYKGRRYINILLLGVDSRSNEYTDTRSDTIIIVTVDQKLKTVKLASVMRDSYLYDPIRYKLDKINHAFAFGGPTQSIKALNYSLDLMIDEYIVVNFEAVELIIDSVGGVDVYVDKDEIDFVNTYIDFHRYLTGERLPYIEEPGTYTLNGYVGTFYARIRYTSGGDGRRTARQREVIQSIYDKMKNPDYFTFMRMIKNVLPNIKTSLTYNEILNLVEVYQKMDDIQIEEYKFPINGRGALISGIYYHVPVSLEDNVKSLHEFLFNNDSYEVSGTVNKLSNRIKNQVGY